MRTAIAAILLALVAAAATYTATAAGTNTTSAPVADITTASLGLAFLIAWPLGTLIFSPRRTRR